MTDINWPASLDYVLSAEGGYVENPRDPGGATNMGITLAVLSTWRHTAVTKAAVQALTRAEAAAIYHAKYWNSVRGGELPGGVDLITFDGAVNHGAGRAAMFLQQSVGVVADGGIGPLTLAAMRDASPAAIIIAIAAAREAFYRSLVSFNVFGAGWLSRLAATRRRASHLL